MMKTGVSIISLSVDWYLASDGVEHGGREDSCGGEGVELGVWVKESGIVRV